MAFNILTRTLIQTTNRQLSCGQLAMTAASSYKILDSPCWNDTTQWPLVNYIQNRGAARKGKRIARNRANRIRATLRKTEGKKEEKHKRVVKETPLYSQYVDARLRELKLPNLPADNVFFIDKFKRPKVSFEEAIEFHKQVVHPDVMNVPDALVTATIELNLKMKIKKKKYIEKIESTVCYPHLFKYQTRPRKIVALTKDIKEQDLAREAGATYVGSNDIVGQLKKSQLTTRDFDHIVCHTNFLLEFAAVKGQKNASYFPTKSRGNYGEDIPKLVQYFKDGIDYTLSKSQAAPEYGIIECYFGKLDMTTEQLRENLVALFESVNRFKPLNLDDDKQFFERVAITTPVTQEMYFIKFWEIMTDYVDPESLEIELEERQATG